LFLFYCTAESKSVSTNVGALAKHGSADSASTRPAAGHVKAKARRDLEDENTIEIREGNELDYWAEHLLRRDMDLAFYLARRGVYIDEFELGSLARRVF
jgi:hypothetical protein